MFCNNLFLPILLYGGIITFFQAQIPVEAFPKSETRKITDQAQAVPANSGKSENFEQQIAVEHAKIRAEISDITTTQYQILEKLSNLEKQTPQVRQNTHPTQPTDYSEPIDVFESLRFNPLCGKHAAVSYNGKTAFRKYPEDEYRYATVLTQRPLHSNELFEVRLERLWTDWSQPIQIGVTIHSAEKLNFPSDMQYEETGTWILVRSNVFHNDEKIYNLYGKSLTHLKVGDRVGVMRKDDGSLNFYVNGLDQGVAAKDVPADVYGFIDLYGQAVQASIVDTP